MNTQRPGDGFEDRLLHELKSVVADNAKGQPMPAITPRRRFASKRNMSLAGAAGAVAIGGAAAIALPALLGGAAAYAVEPTDDGKLEIMIHELDDPDGLQQELESHGITSQVEYLPEGLLCGEDWYKENPDVDVKFAMGMGAEEDGDDGTSSDFVSFQLDPADFENTTNVLMLSMSGVDDKTSTWAASLGVSNGEIAECHPEEAPEEDGEFEEVEEETFEGGVNEEGAEELPEDAEEEATKD